MKNKYFTFYINQYCNYRTRITKKDNSCANLYGQIILSIPIKRLTKLLKNKNE